jgi:hypothetical protein
MGLAIAVVLRTTLYSEEGDDLGSTQMDGWPSACLVIYWQALDFCIKKVVQISNGKGRFVDQLFQLGNESAGEGEWPNPIRSVVECASSDEFGDAVTCNPIRLGSRRNKYNAIIGTQKFNAKLGFAYLEGRLRNDPFHYSNQIGQ